MPFPRFAPIVLIAACWIVSNQAAPADEPPTPTDVVSYHKQIRPLFQSHCQGCHQPAKANGDYVMTTFEKMVAGGESEAAAIVPGKPDESYLLELIVPSDGEAEMPKDKSPLHETEIALIRKWIEQGAKDDTPENARQRYDREHPPIYTLPPVVTSIDFSPDGKLLAVAGFHEVLLVDADTGELADRLIGLSERLESVNFSPQGDRLLVTGGLPGRTGEVQVWNVKKRVLELSVPITYDTIYGGSWSPDGKLIAFGCSDNSVRAINSKTGDQVLFQGAHNDWVRDTVFSNDGKNLVSVGRDMSVKLTEVATERFIDNITSITPGALKGGVNAVARHPQRDEIVIGGADGLPKVYRMFRQTKRVIGDDANLIRRLPAMQGRIFSVSVSPDGKRIAAASSLDGSGWVNIYSYEFDTGLPDNIKKIMSKTVAQQSAAEKAELEKYWTADVKLIASTDVPRAGVFATAFHPDNRTVAAAGADGIVRLIDANTGVVTKEISPAPLSESSDVDMVVGDQTNSADEDSLRETLPTGAKVTKLTVQPAEVSLNGPFAYAQILVFGELESGDLIDVTRMAQFSGPSDLFTIGGSGVLRSVTDGKGELKIELAGQSLAVPVRIQGVEADHIVDFVRDVNPVLSKLGCNSGTCHGSAAGKNGFKLSLRGYDAIFDVRSFTDDLASRRANIASPDASLMLMKATGAVPHVGGQLTRPGEDYYQIIRDWIAAGAKLDRSSEKVSRIEIFPKNPIVQTVGARQQMQVLAYYPDGSVRDVTLETHIESGNTEVAKMHANGLVESLRRGEAPMLARYEGAYAAATLTVMGDRDGFTWQDLPTNGRIDELTANKWRRLKIRPSELCSDAEFVRRVHLDLTGLPPTGEEVQNFLTDKRDTRVKRDELIDRLIGSDDYVEYWTNKWADLLQVNRKFLGPQGSAAFRDWIRKEVAANTPYDEFVRKVLTADGSNKENPAAAYFKILREPADMMENTTHLFLGVRFSCNKCHDHPFERWTQDQYYETAAYFARVGLKADPASGKSRIGGSAVEGAKPLYEIVFEKDSGEMLHDRTKQDAAPQFPYDCDYTAEENATRRQQLAAWITSADNQYFAKSYVNRLWGYLTGVGIIEPIDDIRAGNPPTNPELLDYLTAEFIENGFDARHIIRLICKSRTYQLSVSTNKWNKDDAINFSHAIPRRLPAEVLYDTVYRVTGATSKFPGVPPGTRAAALPDVGVKLPDGFLSTFGRPARESACECERSSGLQLGPVMALVSGPTIADAIADPNNELAKLVAAEEDDRRLIEQVFLRIMNRPATGREIDLALEFVDEVGTDHRLLSEAIKRRESELVDIRKKQEADRVIAIAEAKTTLEAYEKELAPKLAAMEKAKAEKTAQLEKDLSEYLANIAEKQAAWEKKQQSSVRWTVLDPRDLKATNGAKLEKQADLSVFATGKNGKGEYSLVADTDLNGITAVRLELIADDRLPSKGPGRNTNGNLVLSEFTIKAAPKGKPGEAKPLKLEKALADFNQQNYNVATAIDGKAPAANNGWALAGGTGVTRWATFELKTPAGFEGGTTLSISLNQQYNDGQHTIGRFRISVATAAKPIGLSFPGSIGDIINLASDERTDAQKKLLTEFFQRNDQQLKKKQAAVAESKKPLPIDPQLKKLQDRLADASKPVPEDELLSRLRADAKVSEQQQANKRLTAVQDLAWALINSPAFLFNH